MLGEVESFRAFDGESCNNRLFGDGARRAPSAPRDGRRSCYAQPCVGRKFTREPEKQAAAGDELNARLLLRCSNSAARYSRRRQPAQLYRELIGLKCNLSSRRYLSGVCVIQRNLLDLHGAVYRPDAHRSRIKDRMSVMRLFSCAHSTTSGGASIKDSCIVPCTTRLLISIPRTNIGLVFGCPFLCPCSCLAVPLRCRMRFFLHPLGIGLKTPIIPRAFYARIADSAVTRLAFYSLFPAREPA